MRLSVDIETYSSVDIRSAGLYRYAESPDFEILLIAYAVEDGPVQLVDLAMGEDPQPFLDLLLSENATVHAYNAAFELACLSTWLERSGRWSTLNGSAFQALLPRFRCTMAHAMYCGYPAGLAATGEALGLPADKQKMAIGRKLIDIFCKPAKRRGFAGTRVLPKQEPEQWAIFQDYCRQDVEAEREIGRRLAVFPLPERELLLWQQDLRINAGGVAVDLPFTEAAIWCGETVAEELRAEASAISGLSNPNSVSQLTDWLNRELPELPYLTDLRKETVSGLLEDGVGNAQAERMLEIRQQLGKSSNKKYDAIEAAACADHRVRGLLQYYGARTGRWCLTGDHEVLTPDGWERLDKWQGGDIACFTSSGETLSFSPAKPVQFPYSGPMYHYESQRISQVSTPDHKMLVRKGSGAWVADTVENMSKYRPAIPFTGYRTTLNSLDHISFRILIMTQADGYYCENGDLRFHFTKLRKIERCKTLLRQGGILFFHNELKNNRSTITVRGRDLPLYLRTFRSKTFGPWLLNEAMDVLFDELPNWDGYHCGSNSIQYTTCNKSNADWIQAAAHLSGRSAVLRVKDRSKTNPKWKTAYVLDIWLAPKNAHEIRKKPSIKMFEGIVYCAETRTGCFLVRRNGRVWITGNSGRLVQIQNLPRNYLKSLDFARELVTDRRLDLLKLIYGNVPDVLSQLIRTAFVPAPGHHFVVADFSAIEARVLAWLAQERWVMEVFAGHGRIYEATASAMFGVPVDLIRRGRPEYELRQKGKVATLALGYQGGVGALEAMGALNMGLDPEELPDLVDRWRKANPAIVALWEQVNQAALAVIAPPHRPVELAGCRFTYEHNTLVITLPSGRPLFYDSPTPTRGKFGGQALKYRSTVGSKWGWVPTFGGKLVENIVQAIARDCLAELLLRLAGTRYWVSFHVHDEVVLEVPEVQGPTALAEALQLMAQPLPWAPGLVLKGDGFVAEKYYRKD